MNIYVQEIQLAQAQALGLFDKIVELWHRIPKNVGGAILQACSFQNPGITLQESSHNPSIFIA